MSVTNFAGRKPTLDEVMSRLLVARGPDRETDVWIAGHLGWVGVTKDDKIIGYRDAAGAACQDVPYYTRSLDHARALLPWDKHPGAELHVRTVQRGFGEFYCFVEFTWPSTERQGRATTEPIATCICALYAIEETERQLVPYLPKKGKA